MFRSQIRKEPKHTCPMIDSVKNNLDSLITNIEDLDEVKYLIKSIKDEMEDIRDHVSEIRYWGSDWQEYDIL